MRRHCGAAVLALCLTCRAYVLIGHPRTSNPNAQRNRPCITAAMQDISFLALHCANAIRDGRAHVEPHFIDGKALNAARLDMAGVFDQIVTPDNGQFESIQTDLLDPTFRQALPMPCPFDGLLRQVDELRVALAEATGRRLLEGGGLHLMRYPVGSKFMRHVDEDPSLHEPQRNSISFLIYMTPDGWSTDDGGMLQIYEVNESGAPRQVLPASGTLVVYDSTLEHEVLPTRRERLLISGRFRELDEDWQRRRP
jgi:hypothetical protein